MTLDPDDNEFFRDLIQSKAEVRESDLGKAMSQILTGPECITDIDPRAPLDFYSGETMAVWIQEMSRGRYGGGPFKSCAELKQAVEDLPLSDVDIVEFLVRVTKRRLRVTVQGSGSILWLVWNGSIYEEKDEGFTDTVTNRLRAVLEVIAADYEERSAKTLEEAEPASVKKIIGSLAKAPVDYAKHLKSATGLNAIKRIMTGNESLNFNEEKHEDDAIGYIVEADGRVRHVDDLSTVLEPNPSLLIRKTIGVVSTDDWEDKGLWSQFLLETFGDQADDGTFIRNPSKELLLSEMAGVALMGKGESKHMANIVGTSNSGKSLYIDGLKKVFGDYQAKMSNAGIIKMMGTNFYQDEARGQRFLWISEPDRKNVDEAFLKALTGGSSETVTTSRKGKSSISWTPQCFFHVASNDPIKFDASDDALNKRILTISADNSVEETDPRFDPYRMDKIVEEDVESIYRWVLAGAQSFIDNGKKLHIPDEVKEHQVARAKNANQAVQWVEYLIDQGVMTEDPSVKSMSKMYPWKPRDYDNYRYWATEEGIKDVLSRSELKAAIERYTKRPATKNTDLKQSKFPRLWGLIPGPKYDTAMTPRGPDKASELGL